MAKYDNEKIIAMYKAGEKVEVIAAVVGCHSTNVSIVANNAGLRRRTVTDQSKRDKKIAEEYKRGKFVHEISSRYNVATKTVYRILERLGVSERRQCKVVRNVSVDEPELC